MEKEGKELGSEEGREGVETEGGKEGVKEKGKEWKMMMEGSK